MLLIPHRSSRIIAVCTGAFLVCTTLSCGSTDAGPSGPPPQATPVLTTISVNVSPSTLVVGGVASAVASGSDQNGAPIAVGAIAWSTGSTSVASITQAGVVTGIGLGQTLVIASAGGKQGQQLISVGGAPVASVAVSPLTPTLVLGGGSRQLHASVLDASGAPLAGRNIVWTSSDMTKASVSSTGLVTAVAVGTATITATVEGRVATSSVTVLVPSLLGVTLVAPNSALFQVETAANGADSRIALIMSDFGASPAITDIAMTPNGAILGVGITHLYNINPTTGRIFTGSELPFLDVNALASDSAGMLYAATGNGRLLRRDSAPGTIGGWSVIGSLGAGLFSSGDIAFAPDGTLYGTVQSSGNAYVSDVLARINTSTGAATIITQPPGLGYFRVWGLAFVGETLYGLTTTSADAGQLVRIDLTSGSAVLVRNLTFPASGGATWR